MMCPFVSRPRNFMNARNKLYHVSERNMATVYDIIIGRTHVFFKEAKVEDCNCLKSNKYINEVNVTSSFGSLKQHLIRVRDY